MQKLLLVSIRKSRVFQERLQPSSGTSFPYYSDMLTDESIKYAITLLSGNAYIGLMDRGIFDPTFLRNGDQLLEAFDNDAVYIVGQDRSEQLQQLYHQLLNFVQNAGNVDPFMRLSTGLHLFTRMSIILGQYPISVMRDEQWEKRIPTDSELRSSGYEHLLIQLGIKPVWTIKRPPHQRPQRSTYRFPVKRKKFLKGSYLVKLQ